MKENQKAAGKKAIDAVLKLGNSHLNSMDISEEISAAIGTICEETPGI